MTGNNFLPRSPALSVSIKLLPRFPRHVSGSQIVSDDRRVEIVISDNCRAPVGQTINPMVDLIVSCSLHVFHQWSAKFVYGHRQTVATSQAACFIPYNNGAGSSVNIVSPVNATNDNLPASDINFNLMFVRHERASDSSQFPKITGPHSPGSVVHY